MTVRPTKLVLVSVLLALVAACGGGSGDDDAGEPTSGGSSGGAIGDRTPGSGDYVLTSSVTRGPVVVLAEEAQAGLEAMEDHLRRKDPAAHADARCWLMQRDDDSIEQAMRCGPHVGPDGRESWASVPFASDEAAQSEGRLELRYEARLVGEIQPFMGAVTLVRPDGLEAPEEAYADVVEGTGAERPEPPASCDASGTVSDDAYGTFDLADAELVEVRVDVNDNADGYSYRHDHTLIAWDDDEGRGVKLWIRVAGIPGDEEVQSVSLDLDISNRRIMEGGGSGNPGSIRLPNLPAGLSGYDPATGGAIEAEIEIEGRYSYEETNVARTDLTITCS